MFHEKRGIVYIKTCDIGWLFLHNYTPCDLTELISVWLPTTHDRCIFIETTLAGCIIEVHKSKENTYFVLSSSD